MTATYGFSSICSHVSALIDLYLEGISSRIQHKYGLDESDRVFIESMFEELARAEPVPEGDVPVRHPNRDRYSENNGKR